MSLEELSQLPVFQGTKRAFKVKLNTNFAPKPGEAEPGIKAAVRRRYAKGEVICRAGDYGSTAFLLVEGKAVGRLPERSDGTGVPGRSRGSFARFVDMFRRRTRAALVNPPDAVAVGEVSRYASAVAPRPTDTEIRPGEVFGFDACINFYPREATVVATESCVAIEMLRSVVDSIRDAGSAGPGVQEAYRAQAIDNQLRLSPLTADLTDEQRTALAATAELLDPDSDAVKNGVLYGEGDPSDSVFLVRSGTIKLSRKSSSQPAGGELVFSYLGRGSAFGFESLLPSRRKTPLVLRCLSHPDMTPPILIEGILTIGRSTACEVRVPEDDLSVGRKHCKLEERDGDVTLSDLDSANHTFLNGAQIQSVRVAAGDRIQVVDYTFEVTRRSADATVMGEGPQRFATATGLDTFEVVRLPIDSLRPLRSANPRFADALLRLGRQLESASSVSPELVEGMVELNLYNSQNTLLIDLERCTRCDECVKACSDAHGGVSRFTRDGPRFGKYLVTMACRSCTDPKCMVGCPVGSIRRGDSLEIRIEDWCIGCERCANQCPFGNINMIEVAPPAAKAKAKEAEAPPAKEAAPLRATVCDLCSGYDGPNCVYACPHDAAIRVNPNDFLAEADRRGLLG